MSQEVARESLHDVGYRWPILLLGAAWGAAPALSVGFGSIHGLSTARGLLALGALMTLSLGVLFELDSRQLTRDGDGVPLAWSYALVAPISVVLWALLGPGLVLLPGLEMMGLLAGPPASALLYVWQRGRHAAR